ncbi:MAG TPA: DUF1588 domain-containing protein [Polyangiaceae bacterium]|nr:DUF1588 domain-containing protein [Polyangiaceae bacterium]
MRATDSRRAACILICWLARAALGCSSQVEEPASHGGASGDSTATGAQAAGGSAQSAAGGTSSAGAARGGSSGAAGSGGGTPTGAQAKAWLTAARRSSRAELDNVLRDVLGDTTAPASRFLVEDDYAPYDNDYTLQSASQALIDGLNALAEDVARRALSERRSKLVPCTPTGPGDAVCFEQVVKSLGERLLRRPLLDDEVRAYLGLQAFATETNPAVAHDFYTAVGLFLRAVLQDPEFLYRVEATSSSATPRLSGNEIATRLAFLIWGSTPDDDLLARAASGELDAAAGRAAAARRLLEDPRARGQLHRYHAMWLGYRAIPQSAALARAFQTETGALIDRVVFEERRNYLDLFTLDETYVDASLASHYGLAPPAAASSWVSYGSTGRAGILSHGSVLSAFSKFSDTSPTQRGILVRTRLLCEDVAPPPPSVNVDQPPAAGDSKCKTDRYARHRSTASCAACHSLIDPIGMGLERFDMAGRYREHDDELPECLLDGKGELPGVGSFSGPGELGAKLVQSGSLESCSIRQYLTFATGHRPGAAESDLVQAELAAFRSRGRDLSAWIVDFVSREAFVARQERETP